MDPQLKNDKLVLENGKVLCRDKVVGIYERVELLYDGDGKIFAVNLVGPAAFFSTSKVKEAMRG